MIACVTSGSFSCQPVVRQNVSTETLVSAGSIDITYFKPGESMKPCISFAELQDLRVPDQSLKLSFLAKVTWPIRSPGPEWSGYMQMIHGGEYPGQSSVAFLPMIDMNASDMSCIFSTLHYVSAHAQKHNQFPVITFDQPLYLKAPTILQHEKDDSDLQNIVLRLGGFHTYIFVIFN